MRHALYGLGTGSTLRYASFVRDDSAQMTKTITILGSTGSIGQQALQLLDERADEFQVVGLAAGGNVELLAQQAKQWQPQVIGLADETQYENLKTALQPQKGEQEFTGEIVVGATAATQIAAIKTQITLAAMVGIAGLTPTMAAMKHGGIIALANKEALVCAGALMLEAAKQSGATILPVDSEHSAIYQVFDFAKRHEINKLILTASGGPFRDWPADQIAKATVAQAMNHPTWRMGGKITIDSATLVNKGLELIEAHYLFGIAPEKIDIIVHPQSIIHSMVEYCDGSVLAQLGQPDMRTPLSYCLNWPQRWPTAPAPFSWQQAQEMQFLPLDSARFPAPNLARQAIASGPIAPVGLNAANEVAVAAFLANEIAFGQIVPLIAHVTELSLVKWGINTLHTIEDVLACDAQARAMATAAIAKL